jgi:solute carrier family 6 amino acid transporter-like protein 5/7/9/14
MMFSSGCMTGEERALVYNCTRNNGTFLNGTCLTQTDTMTPSVWAALVNASQSIARSSPSDDFFNNYMLGVSEGFHQLGGIKWELALCFLFAWLLVFLCLAKGITVSGKVTYVTALFPYIVLSILLVRGLTLDGSVDGIIYYVKPDFKKLLSPMVSLRNDFTKYFRPSLMMSDKQ